MTNDRTNGGSNDDGADPRQKRLSELMNVAVEIDEESRTAAETAYKRHQLELHVEAAKRVQLEATKSSIYRQSLQMDDDPLAESPLMKAAAISSIIFGLFSLISLWVAFAYGKTAFFVQISFLTYEVRPYVALNLATGLITCFWIILKLRTYLPGLLATLTHGHYTLPERERIENEIIFLGRILDLSIYFCCIFGFSLFLCSVGWENILSALGGAKATVLVCLIGGTVVWLLLPEYFKE